ncbi:MAG TPA: hypothetical protein VL979_08295 [Solirubrobacteraceae bacterium]|nr:hypothetical protein [Solirubrobacteraceae bacterium]
MSDTVKVAIGGLVERVSKARFDARRDLEDLGKQGGADAPLKAYERVERSALAAERAEATLEAARRATDPARTVELARAGLPGGDGVTVSSSVRVGREPHTYEPGSDRSCLLDCFRAGRGHNHDPAAAERVRRHHREMRIDGAITEAQERALSGSSELGEALLPPQYIMDEAIGIARASRPFVNTLKQRPLPAEGMSLYVAKMKQLEGGPKAGVQKPLEEGTEESAKTENEESQIATIDANQVLARQLLERGGAAIDAALIPSLTEEIHSKADEQALFGKGSEANRELRGLYEAEKEAINKPEWNSEATIKGFYKVLAYCRWYAMTKRKRPATHLYVPPAVLVMIEEYADEQKRPLILPRMFTTVDAAQYDDPSADYDIGAPIGKVGNLLIVEEANIPGTFLASKKSYGMAVGRAADIAWYEAPVVLKVHEDTSLTKELAVRVQAFMYCAMVERYSEAWSFVTGSTLELSAPTI